MASPDRAYWLQVMARLARPVLTAQAEGRLRRDIPMAMGAGAEEVRARFVPLEAVGRLLSGIAPWLESTAGDERERAFRDDLAELTLRAIDVGVAPDSPDPLDFTAGEQCVVDASLLALGLLRAPRRLLDGLGDGTRDRLIQAFADTRRHLPGNNNHLLFAAMIEGFFAAAGEPWDAMRVDHALRSHAGWYLGDGVYSDGPQFHWDYYQSYVIHPYLLALADIFEERDLTRDGAWTRLFDRVRQRARRGAFQQARQIAPDGTFPVIGRSITYRCGAFHLLADMALRHDLPPSLPEASVRAALTATIHRTMDPPGTFDENGWLTIGLSGRQPALAERYINTGSLYFCSLALLPLGLPEHDPFWSAPDEPLPWSLVWNGEAPADKAMENDPGPYGGTGW